MASVTSLDHDVRSQRLARYTPQAGKELRTWIEQTLGEKLAPGDLLDALKDGVALCNMANMVLPPPGVKFKKSAMPFVQMENISQFLKACTMSPLDLHSHDRFLTVDLYESKDPAQVIQCLTAFTRQAHAAYPDRFPEPIGPKKAGTRSRSASPVKHATPAPPPAAKALSPKLTGESTGSHTSSQTSGTVSSWSKKTDEGATAPAWNIHQYGYMGGASQGNQGINFGVRRQITSAAPKVPSLAEKERKRKEKAAEEEKLQRQAEEDERRRQDAQKVDEQRAKEEEEQRWEEETRRQREAERRRIEEQKRQWEEQERQWKEKEELRKKEDAELEASLSPKDSVTGRGVLRGQSLSQYQSEKAAASKHEPKESPEQARVRELEKQLEEARERERQYQAEREGRLQNTNDRSRPGTAQADQQPPTVPTSRSNHPRESDASWAGDEYLQSQRESDRKNASSTSSVSSSVNTSRAFPFRSNGPADSSRHVPEPSDPDDTVIHTPQLQQGESNISLTVPEQNWQPVSSPLGSPNRPNPAPETRYSAYSPDEPRHPDSFHTLKTKPPVAQPAPPATSSQGPRVSNTQETGDAALEQHRDRDARRAAQAQTKAVAAQSKSLLEREMERERERQREWEANQMAARNGGAPTGPREAPPAPTREANFTREPVGRSGSGGSASESGSRGLQFGSRRPILGPRPQK